jgi:hypothetical protein
MDPTELMSTIKRCFMPLALFIVIGAGCAEGEQKSKDAGQAIIDTMKDAEKTVKDAVQEKTDQLEDADN